LKIAILGGTGFIGGHLCQELSGTKHEIIIIGRHARSGSITSNISGRYGNIHDTESLASALKDVDIVYHLVGIIAETGELTFEKTVIGGTVNLVRACEESGVKKIIYLSALGTSGNALSNYYQSKWKAEELIRNSSLEYVIIRPSVVFGPNDKFINMFADMIRRFPIIPIVGDGRYLLQPVYVGDLARILIASAESESAQNKTIEIGGPDQISFRDLIAIIKKILNKKRANIYIPFMLMKPMAAILEKIMSRPPVTVDQLKMLKIGNVCDNHDLHSIYGIELTRLEDKIREYLR
jgi:NADH dehydrogenase